MSIKNIKHFLFDESKKLGEGSTGVVYLGTDLRNGRPVAVKAIELKNIDNEVTQYLLKNQVKALQLTQHPNVLRAIDILEDPEFCYVVTDYLPKGTLAEYIQKKGTISEDEALQIFKQLVDGYDHIFDLNIYHRDLKPHNILFDLQFRPILSDFGYCQISGFLPKPKLVYNVGSPGYMAPQSLVGNLYSENSEVWSLGTILYQMMAGRNYTNGKPVMQAVMLIKRQGPYYPENSSDFVKMILKQCMMLKPEDRMKIKTLKQLLNQRLGKSPTFENNNLNTSIYKQESHPQLPPFTQFPVMKTDNIQIQQQNIINPHPMLNNPYTKINEEQKSTQVQSPFNQNTQINPNPVTVKNEIPYLEPVQVPANINIPNQHIVFPNELLHLAQRSSIPTPTLPLESKILNNNIQVDFSHHQVQGSLPIKGSMQMNPPNIIKNLAPKKRVPIFTAPIKQQEIIPDHLKVQRLLVPNSFPQNNPIGQSQGLRRSSRLTSGSRQADSAPFYMPNLNESFDDAYLISNPFLLQKPSVPVIELRKSGNTFVPPVTIQTSLNSIPVSQSINVLPNRISRQVGNVHQSHSFNHGVGVLQNHNSAPLVIHPVPQLMSSKYTNSVLPVKNTYLIR